MHLLDLIIVFVLLPGITECGPLPGHEIINDCGHLKILNHENLYYGENVTLTFKPQKKSNETLELIKPQGKHFEHVLETRNETFAFVILNSQTTLQHVDLCVRYGCYTGFVRLRFNGTRQDTPTNAFTTPTTIAQITIAPPHFSSPTAKMNQGLNKTETVQQTTRIYNSSGTKSISTNFTQQRRKNVNVTTYPTTTRKVHHPVPTDINKGVVDATIQSLQPRQRDGSSSTFPNIQPNDVEKDIKDQTVLKPSAANDGSPIVIIVVVCAVLVMIIVVAVVVVVCFKRKRRTVAKVPVQATQCVEQVAQEEGYASIEGNECQYAVVNKPKKLSTPQANMVPPVENNPMEVMSQPKKPVGTGELIYADLDKEALTAKPTNAKPTGTLERPSTPTEYVGIDFARTVALENANKQDE